MIRMRNGLIAVVHPSLQVDGYRRHLRNFVKAFHSAPSVQISCCVYAHNYPTRTGALFDFLPEELDSSAPIFCSTDVESMVAFIRERMMHGNGILVAEQIRFDELSPSRLLVEAAGELIRDQNVFTMLDEQIPAQKSIVDAISRGSKLKKKSIVLVDGGPGTGKSVVALDGFSRALRAKRSVYLVSGSAAFTYGMRKLLGPDLAN
jgi:hypothetical protein